MTSMSGCCCQNLEAESSLPCNHGIIVEGMNQCQVLLLALLDGLFVCLVVVRAMQHDFRTISTGGRNLGQRRGQRHDDARVNPVPAGMIGNALRMIAGGGRNHAVGALVAGQGE